MSYYEAFKQVRNRIRKHDASEVVRGCIARLHAPDVASVERMRFQSPWILLLLIKWAILHWDFIPRRKKPLTDADLDRLITMMHDVEEAVSFPSTIKTPLSLMRPIAYQQFWHQEETFIFGFARQALLFDSLPSNHTFEQWFQVETGISINKFLELALIVAVPFFQPRTHYIEESKYFQNLAHTFPPEAIASFLKALAKTPDGLKQYLVSLEEETKASDSEFRERSPLARYPLLNLAGRYYYYSRRLLTYSLETFVYDTLRAHDSEGFMNRFGGLF